MSEEPYVKTLNNMDVKHFDMKASNYRFEAMLSTTVFIILTFISIGLFCYKDGMFSARLTDAERRKLIEIQNNDEGQRRLNRRRQQLQELKSKNKKEQEMMELSKMKKYQEMGFGADYPLNRMRVNRARDLVHG